MLRIACSRSIIDMILNMCSLRLQHCIVALITSDTEHCVPSTMSHMACHTIGREEGLWGWLDQLLTQHRMMIVTIKTVLIDLAKIVPAY